MRDREIDHRIVEQVDVTSGQGPCCIELGRVSRKPRRSLALARLTVDRLATLVFLGIEGRLLVGP